MASITQLLRFTLPKTTPRLAAFNALRDRISTKASIKTQYFGYLLVDQGFPVPKPENEMCWVIQWPPHSAFPKSLEFTTDLQITLGVTIHSLHFNFQKDSLEKALRAPICQLAIINLTPTAPRLTASFEASMHKTFTDCYLAPGFTGGSWAYNIDSNNADREPTLATSISEEKDRKLAFYFLGWESLQAHHSYAKTALFDEEIDKLKPWFGEGTGAFYVEFERHG